jgi:hypothetical protein
MNKLSTHNTQQVFGDKNLWCMKQLYETYQADEKLSPLLRELPWTQFERTMLGNTKLSAVLRELQLNINQTFKDNYVIEFLWINGGNRLYLSIRNLTRQNCTNFTNKTS